MRYTQSERQAHLDLWRESGLSKAAYCRQAGLPYHCLVSWSRPSGPTSAKEEGDSGETGAEGFIELDHLPGPPEGIPGATVDLGPGRRLAIAVSADPEWAGRLLGAVFGC
jgi:hypothetical protein